MQLILFCSLKIIYTKFCYRWIILQLILLTSYFQFFYQWDIKLITFSSLFSLQLICRSLQIAATIKGMTFDRVIAKLRELYANGVTTIRALRAKIREFIGQFNPLSKRSADITGTKVTVYIVGEMFF